MDDQASRQLCADLNAKSDEDLADFRASKNDGRERAAAKTRAIYS